MSTTELLPQQPPRIDEHPHAVQFYDDDAHLCRVVADFLREGLHARRPAIVIGTEAHRVQLADLLGAQGVEVARLRVAGQLVMLDAGETLAGFMEGDAPDPARFEAVLGSQLEVLQSRGPAPIHAFGEMVDLLWKSGNARGAIGLEQLWNALRAKYGFTLLCGYDIGSFEGSEDSEAFLRVCAEHDHVHPTGRYHALPEAERERWVAALEQRGRALDSEVAYRRRLEARLRAAAAEASAANRAKSDFLAVMSHELRTPLNAIGGYVELLEMGIRGPVTEAQRQDLQRIRNSQRHLLGLVNEVLNYTRLETGTVEYQTVEVPAREALYAAEALVAPLARARGQGFAVEPCDPAVTVRADPEKLRQILVNLLSNAVKFTPAGGAITLCCEVRSAAVRFVVRDTGIGIPAEKLEAIFEPFVQVRSDLSREHEGTGLGLAISRSIAEGMDGTLVVASREGVGSEFILELPTP